MLNCPFLRRFGLEVITVLLSTSLFVHPQVQVQVGYTILTADPGFVIPVGSALFTYTNARGTLVSQTGIAAAHPILSGRIFVDEAETQTSLVLVNASQENASVSFILRDAAGKEIQRKTRSLGAGKHFTRYVAKLFTDLPSRFMGSLTFEGDQKLAALTLRHSRNVEGEPLFATLPVIEMGTPAGGDRLIFPQIAAGSGYSTQIVLINPTSRKISGQISLTGSFGQPLSLRSEGRTASQFSYQIDPHGTYCVLFDYPEGLASGYAVVTPDPSSTSPSGSAIFQFRQNNSLVTEACDSATLATTSARIFLENVASYTGVALANPSDQSASVTFSLIDRHGSLLDSTTRTLEAKHHLSIFAHELFPELSNQFTGLLDISSSVAVAPMSLKLTINDRGEQIITTLPVADLTRLPSASLVLFPQIAIGEGFSTRLILINADKQRFVTGQIRFFQMDGHAMAVAVAGKTESQFPYEVLAGGTSPLDFDLSDKANHQVPSYESAPIASITILDPDSGQATKEVVVNEGSSAKISVLVLDTDGVSRTDVSLSYASLSTDIATVDGSGKVQGIKAGFSTLTISSGVVLTTGTITVAKVDSGSGGFDINGITQDRARRLYMADSGKHTILLSQDLKQTPVVYAGVSGTAGFKNDVRLKSLFNSPASVALNQARGELYVSDSSNHIIRTVQPGSDGHVETLAGTGTAGSRDGAAASATFNNPQGIALDNRGNLWVVDSGNHTIRRANLSSRTVDTVAGKAGYPGSADGSGDAARFNAPIGISLETEPLAKQLERESKGDPPPPVSMIVADTGNGLIRRVKEDGRVDTITASEVTIPVQDKSGRWRVKPSSQAPVSSKFPTGVAVDLSGNIYVTESRSGRVITILKTGKVVSAVQSNTSSTPKGVVVPEAGKVVVAGGSGASIQVSYGAPQIASITPDHISIKGGEKVTVLGSNFAPDTVVVVANVVISGAEIVDTKTFKFTAVALPSGRTTLTVQNRGGLAQTSWIVDAVPLSQLSAGYITTFAGGSTFEGDGGAATLAPLALPGAITLDTAGNILISDTANNRVRKIDAVTGVITSVAGNGGADFAGDNGLALAAQIDYPYGIALDAAGNLFIADSANNRIRQVSATTGVITSVAGTGDSGFSGDDGPAAAAKLAFPFGLAIDSAGNLFFADSDNHRVRKISAATGIITTVAGTGDSGFSGDDGPATEAQLKRPLGVAVDSSGNLLIADRNNDRIRRVSAKTGIITTVAGTGGSDYSGDNGPAVFAKLNNPGGIATDAADNLYISDTNNHRIRKVDAATGIITTIAGNGGVGFSGDGGSATDAQLRGPIAVALDGSGNLFIVDRSNNRIRKLVAKSGIITTLAGSGERGTSGDAGPAIAAGLSYPFRVATDSSDNLFIADTNNNRVRKVDAKTGTITTVAGTGTYGYSGDDGLATSANLRWPYGVAVDSSGNVYIADTYNQRVRKVDPITKVITTVAGTGNYGLYGDSDLAVDTDLALPRAVAVDAKGNLYISDTSNDLIRRVDAVTKIIRTVAGSSYSGYSGDGGPATAADLNSPQGVVVDAAGNLYIADGLNNRIRRVDAVTKIITTVAGNGEFGYSGDNGLATAAQLAKPSGIAVDADRNLIIADTLNLRVRKVDSVTKIISTIAGTGDSGFSGDNGPATSAWIKKPVGLAIDSIGNLYVGDTNNSRIRAIRSIVGLASCNYTISPTSQTHGNGVETASVSVKTSSNCSWTAISNASWVRINVGSSGVGNANVTYSVEAWPNVGSRIGSLTIAGRTFTIKQNGSGATVFTDVSPGYWAYDYIIALYDNKITSGCGNGLYCPADTVMREEAAAFIIRAIEGDYSNSYCSGGSPYVDVPASSVFCGNIKRLSELGITKAVTYFYPKNSATRGEVAALIIRAKLGEIFSYSSKPYFSDVSASHPFFKYVQKMKELGITRVTGTYNVDANVRRDETAAFIARAFLAYQY